MKKKWLNFRKEMCMSHWQLAECLLCLRTYAQVLHPISCPYLPYASSQCGSLENSLLFFFFSFFFFHCIKKKKKFPWRFFPLQLPTLYVLQSAKLAKTQQVAHMVCMSVWERSPDVDKMLVVKWSQHLVHKCAKKISSIWTDVFL